MKTKVPAIEKAVALLCVWIGEKALCEIIRADNLRSVRDWRRKAQTPRKEVRQRVSVAYQVVQHLLVSGTSMDGLMDELRRSRPDLENKTIEETIKGSNPLRALGVVRFK